MTIGWKLSPDQRTELLRLHPPAYPRAIADHITFKPPGAAPEPLPPLDAPAIVGRADDGQGVEAMVVSIAGSTHRPDGSTWHITWSLAEGREARESNDILAGQGWTPFPDPIPLRLSPAEW